jgi:hypothetical protein
MEIADRGDRRGPAVTQEHGGGPPSLRLAGGFAQR